LEDHNKALHAHEEALGYHFDATQTLYGAEMPWKSTQRDMANNLALRLKPYGLSMEL
jgi:hypothetical protein